MYINVKMSLKYNVEWRSKLQKGNMVYYLLTLKNRTQCHILFMNMHICKSKKKKKILLGKNKPQIQNHGSFWDAERDQNRECYTESFSCIYNILFCLSECMCYKRYLLYFLYFSVCLKYFVKKNAAVVGCAVPDNPMLFTVLWDVSHPWFKDEKVRRRKQFLSAVKWRA